MQYREFQVENYKCFFTRTKAVFGPGFNFIVGQNNAGKSALLSALVHQYSSQNDPHRSRLSMPNEGDLPLNRGLFMHQLQVTDEDLFRQGIPFGESVNVPLGRATVATILDQASSTGVIVEASSGGTHAFRLPSVVELTPRDQGFHWTTVRNDLEGLTLRDDVLGPPGSRVSSAPSPIHDRIDSLAIDAYRFAAERLNVGHYPNVAMYRHLQPSAANLPEVINKLQELPEERQAFIDLVRYVLPQIKDITAESGNGVHLVVWREDRSGKMRRDLAVTLAESGTGIGQVLAILYVASHYKNPKVILIDEINAFLHPDAARRLLEALSMFPQHQYIIATHNPGLFSVVEPSAVLHVTSDGQQSKIENIDCKDIRSTQSILIDVGVRLSDVFSSESVLWVEGPTEEAVFKDLLPTISGLKQSVQIIGIVNTGDLETDDRKLAAQVYERLSKGGNLLPPTVAFIMDSEGRTDKELEEISNRTAGRAFFLERRLIENYLIDPESIASVLNNEMINSPPSRPTRLKRGFWRTAGSASILPAI